MEQTNPVCGLSYAPAGQISPCRGISSTLELAKSFLHLSRNACLTDLGGGGVYNSLTALWEIFRGGTNQIGDHLASRLSNKLNRFVAMTRKNPLAFAVDFLVILLGSIQADVFLSSNKVLHLIGVQDRGWKGSGDPYCIKLTQKDVIYRSTWTPGAWAPGFFQRDQSSWRKAPNFSAAAFNSISVQTLIGIFLKIILETEFISFRTYYCMWKAYFAVAGTDSRIKGETFFCLAFL